jgi:hypothetical protein
MRLPTHITIRIKGYALFQRTVHHGLKSCVYYSDVVTPNLLEKPSVWTVKLPVSPKTV